MGEKTTQLCIHEGCKGRFHAKGYCKYHYQLSDPVGRRNRLKAQSKYRKSRKGKRSIKAYKTGVAGRAAAKRYQGKHIKAIRQNRRRYIEVFEQRFKRGATKERLYGTPWLMTPDTYYPLLEFPCHYCKGPLDLSGIGLDRIDNRLGYEPTNVVPCCGRCNRTRGDRHTKEEMEVMMAALIEFKRRSA